MNHKLQSELLRFETQSAFSILISLETNFKILQPADVLNNATSLWGWVTSSAGCYQQETATLRNLRNTQLLH